MVSRVLELVCGCVVIMTPSRAETENTLLLAETLALRITFVYIYLELSSRGCK
jgi:hypothetical protein